MARRRNKQNAAHTPPAGSSDDSGKGMRPDLALMMEQQAVMVTRLEELERERLELLPPTGETFGPIDTTRSRAIVPALRATATFPVTVHAHDDRASNGAQGQLQQAGHQLQSEAELHRRQQDSLSAQAEVQHRELAHFEAQLRQEREELALQHARQAQAVQKREQSLYRAKQEVVNEQDLQRRQQAPFAKRVKAANDAHRAWKSALSE
uniref:Uncharacterized protein n=1 Tax=Hyaloperonospora arabidopsidis (strain Emoy2) TaxID=559515 RepID=M4C3Y0_HYAAE